MIKRSDSSQHKTRILFFYSFIVFTSSLDSKGLSSGAPQTTLGAPANRIIFIGDFWREESQDYKLIDALDRIGSVAESVVLQTDEVDGKQIISHIHNFSPNVLIYSAALDRSTGPETRHSTSDIELVLEHSQRLGILTLAFISCLDPLLSSVDVSSPLWAADHVIVDEGWDPRSWSAVLAAGARPIPFGPSAPVSHCEEPAAPALDAADGPAARPSVRLHHLAVLSDAAAAAGGRLVARLARGGGEPPLAVTHSVWPDWGDADAVAPAVVLLALISKLQLRPQQHA